MLSYDADILNKIAEMKAMRARFEGFDVYELHKVHWAAPDGAITYCATGEVFTADLVNGMPEAVQPCEMRIVSGDSNNDEFPANPEVFSKIPMNAYLSDDDVDVDYWDGDDEFTRLMQLHGEGARAEVFLWCPAVDLLLRVFDGHLESGKDQEQTVYHAKISAGFKSPDTTVPAHPQVRSHCQDIFGGTLSTQEEISRLCASCIYNRGVPGGTIGNLDPETGEPYPDCDKSIPACIARLGDSKSHLSHTSQEDVVVNPHGGSGNLYPRAEGNETTMGKKLRWIMGQRYAHDLNPVAIIKLPNGNNGLIRVEIREIIGPIAAVISPQINAQLLPPSQYEPRVGHQRELATNFSPHAWNFSRIAGFLGIYGFLNTDDFEINDIKGHAIIQGYLQRNLYPATTILAGTIDADDTEVELVDASAFPASGDVEIGGEWMHYASKSGNTLIRPRFWIDYRPRTAAHDGNLSSRRNTGTGDDDRIFERSRLADPRGGDKSFCRLRVFSGPLADRVSFMVRMRYVGKRNGHLHQSRGSAVSACQVGIAR